MSTPTPRTDKMSESLLSKTFLTSYVTMQELARTLERELTAERDQLRARAELAEADAAAERARLDSGQILLTVSGERVWHCGVDLRAAIDAGMREGAK